MSHHERRMKCVSCNVEFKKKRFPVNDKHAVKCDSCFHREDCKPMTGRFGL